MIVKYNSQYEEATEQREAEHLDETTTVPVINEKIIEAANEKIIRLKTCFYFIIIILIIIILTFSIKCHKKIVSDNQEKKWQHCDEVKCSETNNNGKVSKEEIRKARLTFRIFSETNNNEKASLI